ncbi:hypothetical protein Nepgr_018001 [Nepenthes gracilis]|uniref:Uncharacterized protein n=1 Tax=Nepenthes gracilis TaxID=150966 RepID=A0AAD3SQG9_NEPGR|nr:hypothetical protein Nepgr_018001 [Nepenthes gracilis]
MRFAALLVRGLVFNASLLLLSICNSFIKAVVGPCCSLFGRAGTLLSLCSLLNCGEMWCGCLAIKISLLLLLRALDPDAVMVSSAGVLKCISVGCCFTLKLQVDCCFGVVMLLFLKHGQFNGAEVGFSFL